MKKEALKKECPYSSAIPQIFKCMGYVLKSYAGVGIALALFMLVGLQIEQQYRGQRYMGKCINHLSNPDLKISEQERNFACANIYRESPSLFEYYKGNILKFMPENSFR
ncbi:MAG: hypothetical protein FF85_05005 [alpha proteobacterium QL1]|jgi:hypothetical protein|nr:MAG: hypothetical protein FF85_05005 [alpha proteobacterium QL1]